MAERRNRSIGTKVTAGEYDLMTKLAAPKTVSEWARTILLDAAKPDPFQMTLLAEIIGLRAIVLMINMTIGQGKHVDDEFFSQLCRQADDIKFKKAEERLVALRAASLNTR